MRRAFLSILFFAPCLLRAQDLTGVWQGHFRQNGADMRSMSMDDRYKFEVQIAQHDKSIDAVTYSYLSTIFYGKAAAGGTVNVHTGKVLLQEGKLLEVRNATGGVCIMTCFLQYSKSGDDEFLEGSYVSMNVSDSSNCGRGTVFLHKVASSDFYEEPFLVERKKELNAPSAKTEPKPAPPKTGTTTKKPVPSPGGSVAKNSPPPAKHPAATPPIKRPADATTAKTGKTGSSNPTAKTPPKRTTPPGHRDSSGLAARAHPPVTKPQTPEKIAPIAKIATPQQTVRQLAGDSGADMSTKFPNVTPKVLLTRSNELVKALTVHSKEVVLNIYDDGAIDHDTISVYLDNKQVISHAMLTDRALVVTLHLDDSDDFHRLVLVAENEGDIPPNTSLMIVKAGDKEYEVRITSTEQKNAVVTFKYVK